MILRAGTPIAVMLSEALKIFRSWEGMSWKSASPYKHDTHCRNDTDKDCLLNP